MLLFRNVFSEEIHTIPAASKYIHPKSDPGDQNLQNILDFPLLRMQTLSSLHCFSTQKCHSSVNVLECETGKQLQEAFAGLLDEVKSTPIIIIKRFMDRIIISITVSKLFHDYGHYEISRLS